MDRLLEIISEIGIPSAYDHFAEGESPNPPFICYLIPASDNFSADGIAYFKANEIHIELYTDKKDNLVARAGSGWVSSDYQITWLFFGEKELFIYQYTFSMISDSKRENTMQYFYQDVTNFAAASETYQKWTSEPKGGCSGGVDYMQVSADADEFKIVVPGDTLRCSMTSTDSTDAAIRGMRNKLREMKNR